MIHFYNLSWYKTYKKVGTFFQSKCSNSFSKSFLSENLTICHINSHISLISHILYDIIHYTHLLWLFDEIFGCKSHFLWNNASNCINIIFKNLQNLILPAIIIKWMSYGLYWLVIMCFLMIFLSFLSLFWNFCQLKMSFKTLLKTV